MVVLAKLWTFTGEIYIPIALAWGAFVRGGTPGDFKEGVLITWGYWGVLLALAIGRGAIRAAFVAMLLTIFSGGASAQVNCEAIPHGPARTDCYLGLSQFYRGQSDLAAARARAQSDAAWYRAITGTDPPKHKPHRRR